jgi:hypothetical protein
MKEVHIVINIDMTISRNGSFGMPETIRLCVADVRALQGTAVSAAGTKAAVVKSDVRGTDVRGYAHITDVVLTGAFPGTPAWSPPI